MNKKIFIINSFTGGGAERVVGTLCRGFVNKGVETHLIFLFKELAYPTPENVNIHYLFKNKPSGLLSRLLFICNASVKLNEVLRSIEVDANTLITSHLPLSNLICSLNKPANHYCVIHCTYSTSVSLLKQLFFKILYYRKDIIAVSDGVANDLIHELGVSVNSSRTIYNPFDVERIKEQSRDIFKGQKYQPYIIHIGRFIESKKHDILIKAFSKLNYGGRLLLLGEGKKETEIRKLVKSLNLQNQVLFLGWKNNPYPWIRKAQLLVLSSSEEGLPTVLIEALICGTPVVSTDCKSGPSEILTGELSKYLARVGDVEDLSNKMEAALSNYAEIDSVYVDKYQTKNIVKQYISLLSQ